MRSLLIAAAIAALATPALADANWSATPVQPVVKADFVAASVIWACTGDKCVTRSDTANAVDRTECKKLVSEIGALSQFVGDKGPFSADKLAACNQWAAKAK